VDDILANSFFLLLRSIFRLSMVLRSWDRSEFELYRLTSSERLRSIFGIFPWIDLAEFDLRSVHGKPVNEPPDFSTELW